MFKIRFNLKIYRYEALLAVIILLLTGSFAVSSRNKENSFPPVQRYPYKIALTFDDGPHPGYTPRLMMFLRENNIKASFFVVGDQVVKYPHLLKIMAGAGHEIENHTTSHPNLAKLSGSQVKTELLLTRELIKTIANQESIYFRPPGGQYNDKVVNAAKSLGLEMALWTVFPKDYQDRDPEIIINRVLEQAADGGVILLHSGLETTMAALPEIIKQLKKRGYQFVTISHLRQSEPANKLVWLK